MKDSDNTTEEKEPLTTTRRGWLRTGLAAGAGLALPLSLGSNAAAASYETVTIPAGEVRNIVLDGSTVHENILYDVTANGAGVTFRLYDNVTVRNVGIKGKNQAGRFIFRMGGGTEDITIDHVYTEHFDDSVSDAPGGILATVNSVGNFYGRGITIKGFGDDAMYFSKSDMTVTIEDSCIVNNRTGGFRAGGNYHGNNRDHIFRNCRFVCDDGIKNVALYDSGGDRVRGFIGKHGTIEMHNCHSWIKKSADAGDNWLIVDSDTDSGAAECKLWDCELAPESRIGRNVTRVSGNGNNPSDQAPSYAPTSAEDAASGPTSNTDTSVAVSTGSATSVAETSATLNGSLDDLGGASSTDVHFEYRETGASNWTATATQTLSSTGSFSESVSNLSTATDYEFRAVASASDGDTDTGSAVTFTTGSGTTYPNDLKIDGSNVDHKVYYEITVSDAIVKGDYANDNDTISGSTADGQVNGGFDTYDFSGEVTDVQVSEDIPIYVNGNRLDLSQFESAPTIDRYEVTEAGSENPHANITVEWDVSDADGDLSSATVEVLDGSGTVVDSATTNISDDVHYGVDYFDIKHVDGQTFDVRTTVTDAAGNQASATKTVQE